jgi:hypothetical protein
MERILQHTRVRDVSIRLVTEDGYAFVMQSAPGEASFTVGHLPGELSFLEHQVLALYERAYVALILKPDPQPGLLSSFRIDVTGSPHDR